MKYNSVYDDPNVIVFEPTKKDLTEEDDVWFGILEHKDGYAVDVNYFIEREDDECDGNIEDSYCTLYPCYPDKNGLPVTDCSEWKRIYEFDLNDSNWKDILINEAYKYLLEIIDKDRKE